MEKKKIIIIGGNAAGPAAAAKAKRILSLPIFPEMREEQQDAVIRKISEFYKL